jgi:hypothetical protein
MKSRIPPPPPVAVQAPSPKRLPEVPTPAETPSNLSVSSDGVRDLNFKVSPEFHLRFKTTATVWGMSMKDLLEASYAAWVEKFGSKPGG